MSFRPTGDSSIRAVRALSQEAAEMPLPRVDWDRIESRLLAQVAEGERPVLLETPVAPERPVPARPAGSPWVVALAAAAAVALVAGARWGDLPAPRPATGHAFSSAAIVRGVTLGDTLRVGDVTESAQVPLVYEKAGLVTFTLEPSSRVQLVAAEPDGDGPGALTISLARGSVHAEVRPQAVGESFAIEVERTRVAVHGTSFTVSREGDRVLVEVTHGSVAVGPNGHPGETQGWLLVGPDRGSFSLDGARVAQWLASPASHPRVAGAPVALAEHPDDSTAAPINAGPRAGKGASGSVAVAGAAAAAPQRVARSQTSHLESAIHPESAGHAPEEPGTIEKAPSTVLRTAAEQEEAAMAGILKGLEGCYEGQVSSSGVVFSIRSSLTVSVLPTGAVREGVFNPPLSPTLMNCVHDAITSAHFPTGEAVRQIHVPVNLSRPR